MDQQSCSFIFSRFLDPKTRPHKAFRPCLARLGLASVGCRVQGFGCRVKNQMLVRSVWRDVVPGYTINSLRASASK